MAWLALLVVMAPAIVAGAQTWQYGYDAMGRLTTALDPNGLATYTYYDSLGRPIQTQQPANTGSATPTTIGFAYNARDDLTQVNDPRNLATSYSPNGLGNVTAQTSPDSISKLGGFAPGPGSMGNKWFAESAAGAAAWGKKFFSWDKEPVFTLSVQMPKSLATQMTRVPKLDNIGPALSADGALLQQINVQGNIRALTGNLLP